MFTVVFAVQPFASITFNVTANVPVMPQVTICGDVIEVDGEPETNTNIIINPLPLAIITGTNGVCTFPSSATMTAVNLAGYSFAWSPSGNTPSITQTIFGPTTF